MKASKKKSSTKYQPRIRRTFSSEFKQTRVEEIEAGLVSISQVCKAYGVTDSSVRKWITRYSRGIELGHTMVVQLDSEAARTLALEKRGEKLERIIGQKQLQIDYYEKLIAIASEEMGVDIKKNFDGKFLTDITPKEDLRIG